MTDRISMQQDQLSNWSMTSATLAATCRTTGVVKKMSRCALEKQHHYLENEKDLEKQQ